MAIGLCECLWLTLGCNSSFSTAAEAPPTAAAEDPRGAESSGPSFAQDAGSAKADAYRGNPLCHPATCMPDDDGSRATTAGYDPCATAALDGGADAGSVTGCRIARNEGKLETTCGNALPNGTDGVSCETGEDCAAGFDCVTVGNDKGSKTCRHYCCSGSCKGYASQSGGAMFCDVQGLVDVNQKAPVCLPIKHCKLLADGECAPSETCAVVTESGDTGCVATGDQQAGNSCDEAHCAAGLTCLGQPGSRKCLKLCRVGSNDCGQSQLCETSTIFKDSNFGICDEP